MRQWASFTMGILVVVFVAAGGTANPAMAQTQAPKLAAVNRVLIDNPKVLVGESTWAPGAENSSVARPPRVLRALNGGTLTVIYADGKIEKRTYKTGEVHYLEQDAVPNVLKNEGTTEIKIYYVFLK